MTFFKENKKCTRSTISDAKRRLGDLILLQTKISKMEHPFEYALQCESGLVSI